MAKFGNIPARSPETFGVVGLLGDPSKIYYSSIFSSRHIGRVSDLLTARLKDIISDELRFRVVLMFNLYEGYRCQLDAIGKSDGGILPEPLVIECGVDEEKIALGVSFTLAASESRVEKFIAQMAADSDQVVVRVQPESRRIEIVSMIGRRGKIVSIQGGEGRPVETYILKADSKVSALKAEYVELADLDYASLLKEDGFGAPKDRPATGEILVRGTEETEPITRISGDKAEEERITRISGVTDRITSGSSRKINGIAGMIKGLFGRGRSAELLERAEDLDPQTSEILREQIERLEETIEKMRHEAQAFKSEPGGSRAHKWAEATLAELLAEKAQVSDMAKKLNAAFRQKEREFRSCEALLREEVKRKDEQLRHKTSALDHAREKLSQMSIAVERSRSHPQGSSEEGQLRQKLSFTQKLLQNAQSESASHVRKIEELKNQLMLAQSASVSKPRPVGEDDIAAWKIKYERILKQNEEFKRANQALLEKVNSVHKPKAGGLTAEETKQKLEMAMRLAATNQKHAEQQKLKDEELQREESRLKSELSRTNASLRAMKASAAAGGKRDDDPNGQAA